MLDPNPRPSPAAPPQAPAEHPLPLCAGLFGVRRMPDEERRSADREPPRAGIWL